MNKNYEVVIIGGGIHGAGIAQAAAAAGYKTLIIEKDDWAHGTSSKSSKLIHGGLRYLENAQFSLVWESLRERRYLLSLAPSLVKPLQFMIPIYKNTRRRPWQLVIGLSLYSILARFSRLSGFSYSSNTAQFDFLKQTQLQKLFFYWDAQTDDIALTRAVIKSAEALGATCLHSSQFLRGTKVEEGYELNIIQNNEPMTISANYLINAAGPWANNVLATLTPTPTAMPIDLVKGSHLILEGQLSDNGLYLESPSDGRAVFALPWYGNTLLGTTEKKYSGNLDEVDISEEEKTYLLDIYKHYFPDQDINIVNAFAGLRVLPRMKASPFARPRECIFHQDTHHPHLLTLYGGKLTGYRHTAEKVITYIKKTIGNRKAIASTKNIPLQ